MADIEYRSGDSLLGQMSAYLLPAALLLVGVILYLVSTR